MLSCPPVPRAPALVETWSSNAPVPEAIAGLVLSTIDNTPMNDPLLNPQRCAWRCFVTP